MANSNSNDINDLENKIIKSVEMQCFADVNIGSPLRRDRLSLITAIASKFKKDLKAFHGYFPEDKKSYSEIEYAREVAKHLNIELFEIGITYKDFIENFKDIIHYLDYPIVGPEFFHNTWSIILHHNMSRYYLVDKEEMKFLLVMLGI